MYAYAATAAQVAAQDLVTKVNDAILFPLITLLMALALLLFLYGAFEYVRGASNEADREKGKRHLLYGIIGMLVMLSAYAILSIAAATFNLDDELMDASETGGIFGNGTLQEEDSFYIDRAPSAELSNDDAPAYDESEVITEEVYTPTNDVFSDGIETFQYNFYKDQINAAQESGTIEEEEIIGYQFLPNGKYPEDYEAYEASIVPECNAQGGTDVFSISVNNDNGRQFYCVHNLP